MLVFVSSPTRGEVERADALLSLVLGLVPGIQPPRVRVVKSDISAHGRSPAGFLCQAQECRRKVAVCWSDQPTSVIPDLIRNPVNERPRLGKTPPYESNARRTSRGWMPDQVRHDGGRRRYLGRGRYRGRVRCYGGRHGGWRMTGQAQQRHGRTRQKVPKP
jgi:hypothetical protein